MKKIDSLIKDITKKPKISEGLRKIDIQEVVKKVLGRNLLNYIKDIHVMDEKLIIKLNSSSLRSELSYSKDKLLKNINDNFQESEIKEIILK
ncbi:DUF721 domain-containing protein [Bacteroidota bacterium]|nr:DUF721 domain-containing protein [Bacteroidota bacterium]MDC3229768.1 DUF721 domain-containing protein [Bacteroidota bacterium]